MVVNKSADAGFSKWIGHLLQASAVIFAAGILYTKVETVEIAVGEIKHEIEPGILPIAEVRVKTMENEVRDLRSEVRELRNALTRLERQIFALQNHNRISP